MNSGYSVPIGQATDFERNEETGEISLDIVTKYELIDNVNVHITLYNIVRNDPTDVEEMVIESADLESVFVSIGDSAWPELNRKKVMTEVRDCPDCEQGKHPGCLVEVLTEDDQWVPCPCKEREHKKKSREQVIEEDLRKTVSGWDE
jgi:hypothetical protein